MMQGDKRRTIEKHKRGWAVVELEWVCNKVFKKIVAVYRTKSEALDAL